MPVDHVVRQIAGRVDHDGDPAAPLVELPVLLTHVVGLGRFDLAPLRGQIEHRIRRIGVDMHSKEIVGDQHDDRASQFAQA